MKRTQKRVTIISRESDSKTLDVAMLEAELLRRGIDVKVLCRLLTKDSALKAAGYLGHVARQEAAILTSDVVVLDTYCIPASMIPHRSGTKVVQMWHALGAVKRFGWQTVGKEGGSSEKVARIMKMHRGYDYVVCASDITAEYFCEAFRTDRDKIMKLGLPRIDYIKSVAGGERRADTAKRILSRYPALRPLDPQRSADPRRSTDTQRSGDPRRSTDTQRSADPRRSTDTQRSGEGSSAMTAKKTILYAPTFRPGKAVDVQSLIGALEETALGKYNLVVKLHPLYRGNRTDTSGPANGEDKCGDEGSSVIYDDDFPTNDWLSVADIIISDYSSFVIESTLADKPLYLYTYDIDEYSASTGLNMDFDAEPIAPYVFKDAAGLASAIDRDAKALTAQIEKDNSPESAGYDYAALRAFRDRYIDPEVTGEVCTAVLADFIEGILYR